MLHGVSFTLAFLAISFVHVVIGEVVPKNLALEKADRLALLVAPALLVFDRISAPFVYRGGTHFGGLSRAWVSAAAWRRRPLGRRTEVHYGVQPPRRASGNVRGGRDPKAAGAQGHLRARDHDAAHRHRFGVRSTRRWTSCCSITLEHKYSRLPVYEGKPEHIIGFVHYKDLMRVWRERKNATDRRQPAVPFRLRRYLREPTGGA